MCRYLRKILRIVVVMVLLFVLSLNLVFAQSAKEAIRALKKIEAKTQVGISYRDYSQALGDAKFEVNLFLESPEAKKRPALAKSIQKVMDHYEYARLAWSYKFEVTKRDFIYFIGDGPGSSFVKIYPQANKDWEKGGALVTSETSQIETTIHIPSLLSIIWEEASKELKKATSLLSK